MKCKSKRKCRFLILVLGSVFLPAMVFCRFSKLERAFPVDQRFELIEFRARDKGKAPLNFAGWDRRFSCREYLQSLRRRVIFSFGPC
uniref:Uncharacterized protein n=1 Tax=Nelumbo nucifera TaxID=4432 RepID=A0A822Z7D0_NELNU|nr:TPA_asm: hypothetical protein HUJ06_000544 [Nelumbo nucifera]